MDFLPFGAPTAQLASLVRGVDDHQLEGATPCPDWTVADLLRHIGGLTLEFTASASKTPTPARAADGLTDGWRGRIADDLAGLAAAWESPDAYTGETHAGPITMPGREAGRVALNEVTVHAWDLARATGQPFAADPEAATECAAWVAGFAPPPGGAADDGGLFGPVISTPDDADSFDRLLGLTGRDRDWTPPVRP